MKKNVVKVGTNLIIIYRYFSQQFYSTRTALRRAPITQGRPRQHRRHHVHQGCRPDRGQHRSNQRRRTAGHQLLYRHKLRFHRHLRLYYAITPGSYTAFIHTPGGGGGGDSRLREPALFMYNFKRKNQGTRDPSLSKVCQSI